MYLETLPLLIPTFGVIALIFTWWKTQEINKSPEGSKQMEKIAASIQEGAMAFLKAEYRVLFFFVLLVAGLLYWSATQNTESHEMVALAFVVGAFCSALAGFLGMKVATKANVRTANAAQNSLGEAGSGAKMLGELLAGITASGVLVALFQSNGGGAWDNAKKMVEEDYEINSVIHSKGSEVQKAAVVGDTVGDPLKDTSGPALNILLKLMSVVALVIAPLIKV